MAPEVLQRMLSRIFNALPGVRVYMDDVLMWGATKEHSERLCQTLTTGSNAGLTFNATRDIISQDGTRPNPTLES